MRTKKKKHRTRHYPRIAIVGAGIAGLTAALVLQDAGLVSTIYEASARLGGRIYSDANVWGKPLVIEWGGQFIDSDHGLILHLARRFNLSIVDLNANLPRDAQPTFYLSGRYYPFAELLEDFQPIREIIHEQLQAIGPTLPDYQQATIEGCRLDQLSLADWIARYIPGGRCARLGRLLDAAYTAQYGVNSEKQSALNLVTTLDVQAGNGRFGLGPSDERYGLASSAQQLPIAIAQSLPEQSIQFQHYLVSLHQEKKRVTLTFKTPQGFQEAVYDHVILTLPFSVLRRIDYQEAGFDVQKQTTIETLGYGTISKLMLPFDTRYWQQYGPWPGMSNGAICTDQQFQLGWEASFGQDDEPGILVNVRGGSQGHTYPVPYATSTDDAHIQEWGDRSLEHLEQIFPGIGKHYLGYAALSSPASDPVLRGAYSCWLVGQYTHLRGSEGVRQGQIHFAGEHTSPDYQGYMEGGVASGIAAAREILADLSVFDDFSLWRQS